jgi:hypothetical protein
MMPSILRAVLAAAIGAAAGLACLTVAYTLHPNLDADMDRDLPPGVVSGFYPFERAGSETFVWTSRRADLTLSGLNRTRPWVCSVRFRGGRSGPHPQPLVQVAVDGVTAASQLATNEYQDVQVPVPTRPSHGLSLTISSSVTVVPGPRDRRELGVQIDRVVCRPEVAGLVVPPRRAIGAAAAAGAAFGAALGLAGTTLAGAAAALAVVTAGQAVLLSWGPAPYASFPATLIQVAIWVSLLMGTILGLLRRAERPARFVVIFSAGAFYLKLLGLLHPSKSLVDAVFHAHRFEGVMAGRYYFTQPLSSGVDFPYAIGLYLFAAPWSMLTSDHVTLLRVIVCAAGVVAGALLYVMVVRIWGDRLVAALAVVLFSLLPLPYGVVGSANLTNAFGESVALASLSAVAVWPLHRGRVAQVIGLFLLCSLAFLSHISTFSLLLTTLVAAAFFYYRSADRELRLTARAVLAVTAAAAVFAVVTYYGHFGEVYRTALRARAQAAAAGAPPASTQAEQAQPNAPSPAVRAAAPASLPARTVNALALTVSAIGWPILIMAVAGGFHLVTGRTWDRLGMVLAAWAVAYVAFLGVGVLAPVAAPLQRYAAEFVARVVLATCPAAVILAARGSAWAWRGGTASRVAAIVLLFCACVEGVRYWVGWIR